MPLAELELLIPVLYQPYMMPLRKMFVAVKESTDSVLVHLLRVKNMWETSVNCS
jgi:hypothetical protein